MPRCLLRARPCSPSCALSTSNRERSLVLLLAALHQPRYRSAVRRQVYRPYFTRAERSTPLETFQILPPLPLATDCTVVQQVATLSSPLRSRPLLIVWHQFKALRGLAKNTSRLFTAF